MAAGEASIQQAFGPAWDVLPPDLQSAYENALRVQQARVMLATAAVFGAMNDSEVGEPQMQALQDRLAGLHLSQLEKIGDTAEDLAAQLGLPPYASDEAEAPVLSLIPNRVEAVTVPVVELTEPEAEIIATEEGQISDDPPHSGDTSAAETATEPRIDAEPELTEEDSSPLTGSDASPTDDQAPVEVLITERREVSEPGLDSRSITETELREFVKIFGGDEMARIASLERDQVDMIVAGLCDIYIAGNAKKTHAPLHAQRWKRYLGGMTDPAIARELGVTTAAVSQSRYKLYEIVGRAKPSLDALLGPESVAAVPESESVDSEEIIREPEVGPSGAAEATELVETEEELSERLANELAILGDSLGMSGKEKRALRLRLDENSDEVALTADAREALSAIATKYRRLSGKGRLQLTKLERQLFENVLGVNEGRTTYPLSSAVGMMREDLISAGVTPTRVLVDAVEQMNRASRDVSQP